MKDTLIQYTRGDTPRSEIGMGLCRIDDRTLLVVTDYYLNLLSVEKLKKPNCNEVIKILLKMYAIQGITQEIITDNGPQFRSSFKDVMKQLEITHIPPVHITLKKMERQKMPLKQ